MKHLLFTALFLTGIIFSCRAFTANDQALTVWTDGSYADTTNALAYVSAKAQDGWVMTVGLPNGSYIWPNSISYSAKNTFTMQGADPNNRPQIAFNTANNTGFYLNAASNHIATLKDLIFTWVTNQPVSDLIDINGEGVCFRVTNCKFLGDGRLKHVLDIGSINTDYTPGPYGVIDHCQWPMSFSDTFNLLHIQANGCATAAGGYFNYGWTLPMTWGTTNTVVIEDCQFSMPRTTPLGAAIEADGAARWTFRNNWVTNLTVSSHGVASGARESTLQVEVYNNNFYLNDSSNTMAYLFWQRGGSCVVWSNTIADNNFWDLGKVFYFSVECASGQWSDEHCSNQMVYPADYPGYQQVGRGVVNGAEGWVGCYVWNNTTPGTYYGNFSFGIDTNDAQFITANAVQTNSAMPGYASLVYPHPLVSTTASGSETTIPTNAIPTNPIPTNSIPTNSIPASLTPPSNLAVAMNYVAVGDGSDITNGLIAWYKLSDGSGTTAADSSANGNNASLSANWTTGPNGNGALAFDGASQYLMPSANFFGSLPSFSLSFWLLSSNYSGGSVFYEPAPGACTLIVNWPAAANAPLTVQTCGVTLSSVNASWQNNVWYHVVVTYTNYHTYIFVNGNLDNSGWNPQPPFPATDLPEFARLRYGGSITGGYWAGQLDDIRAYNLALDTNSISTLYSNGAK